MPFERSRYPKDWPTISLTIRRDRAHWACERCGAKQGELTERSKRLGLPWKVVLTVAHLGVPYPDGRPGNKHDKADCRPENLMALCQRCHLKEDLADHVARAHKTRRAKKEAAGQLVMFPMFERKGAYWMFRCRPGRRRRVKDTSQSCASCGTTMKRTRPNRYKCPRCGAWRIVKPQGRKEA